MVPFYPAAPVRAGTLLLGRRPQTGTLSVCRSQPKIEPSFLAIHCQSVYSSDLVLTRIRTVREPSVARMSKAGVFRGAREATLPLLRSSATTKYSPALPTKVPRPDFTCPGMVVRQNSLLMLRWPLAGAGWQPVHWAKRASYLSAVDGPLRQLTGMHEINIRIKPRGGRCETSMWPQGSGVGRRKRSHLLFYVRSNSLRQCSFPGSRCKPSFAQAAAFCISRLVGSVSGDQPIRYNQPKRDSVSASK